MINLIAVYDPNQDLPLTAFDMLCKKADLSVENRLIDTDFCKVAVKNFYDLPCTLHGPSVAIALLGEIESGQVERDLQALLTDPDCAVKNIKGSFLAVRADTQNKNITLITDKFGSYPCYVGRYKSAFIVSSSLLAIAKIIPSPELNQDAVATLLSIGEVVGNATLLNGVETLPAGTIINFTVEGVNRKKYWQYVHEVDESGTWSDRVAETGEALNNAVKSAIKNHDHISVPLSGGLDSRFLYGLAVQQNKSIDAFTWGTPGCRDLEYAAAVCKLTHTPHHTYHFEEDYLIKLAAKGIRLTEGVTPVVNFHVLPFVDKVNISGVSVLLDGFAGDATLGGNFINSGWLDNSNLKQAAANIWQWRLDGFCLRSRELALEQYHKRGAEQFMSLYQNYDGDSSMDKAMAFLLDNRVRRITTAGTQIFRSQILVKQPFMNAEMIEVTRKLPHDWRKRHRFYIDVMKHTVPLVAKAPWQRTSLPARAPYWMSLASMAAQRVLGDKWPFVKFMQGKSPSQFDEWFRVELKPFVEHILFGDKARQRGILPIESLQTAWQLHLSGQIDATNLLGAALTIELFAQQFIDTQ